MQIINNTGAIIGEQINLGDIDNLNIDDLFKDNTSKKMNTENNKTETYNLEGIKPIIEEFYNEEKEMFVIKISYYSGDDFLEFFLGFKEKEIADEHFYKITQNKISKIILELK